MAAVNRSATVPLLLPVTFFLLGFFSTPVLCRHPASHAAPATATASLDVSAALAGASAVLSVDPVFQQEAESSSRHSGARSSSPSSGTFFSLQLHPRESVKKRFNGKLATSTAESSATSIHHKDYKSLTLSRLRRDAVRVHALSTRVALAVDGVHHSKLRPEKHQELLRAAAAGGKASSLLMPDAMQGPVVSGTSQGSGEYFSRVGIGRPAKELYVVLDTGSDVTWVQCQPCADCYQQADPVYDPAASSTYAALGCDSEQCKALDLSACRNSSCLYQVSYGDGSYTVGDFGSETMSFGSATDANGSSVPGVAFGCGHDNEGLFVGAAGLLGLGGGALSFPSQISASSFSYCLVDRDSSGTSTLDFGRGGADDPSVSASAVTAPLIHNRKLDTFYYVGLTGISVGGRMLSIPASAFSMDEAGNGGVIVDSGTAVTRLNPEAYTPLRDAFKAATSALPSAEGVALFDTCYDLSGRETVEVPTVGLHFSDNGGGGGAAGSELRLPAKNYLIPVDSAGTFCLAFAPAGSSSGLSIIGNVQQQGIRVSFDLDNHRVGFAANQC